MGPSLRCGFSFFLQLIPFLSLLSLYHYHLWHSVDCSKVCPPNQQNVLRFANPNASLLIKLLRRIQVMPLYELCDCNFLKLKYQMLKIVAAYCGHNFDDNFLPLKTVVFRCFIFPIFPAKPPTFANRMSNIFGKLMHQRSIQVIWKQFQCTLRGVRILLANCSELSATSETLSYTKISQYSSE